MACFIDKNSWEKTGTDAERSVWTGSGKDDPESVFGACVLSTTVVHQM